MDENLSGAFDEEQYKEIYEEWHECAYCVKVYAEQPINGCCGEIHFKIITEEITKEDMDFYKQERTAMSDEEFFKWIDLIEGNKNASSI